MRPTIMALMLAACGARPPTGQVVASIDGDEVTLRDLATEVPTNGAMSAEEVRTTVLARIVDRKLLAAEARGLALDRTPEYLASVRRLREVALVELLSRKIAAETAPPSPPEVRAYLQAHPWQFEQRRIYLVEWMDPEQTSSGGRPGASAGGAAGGRTAWIDTYDLSREEAERLARTRRGASVEAAIGGQVEAATVLDVRSSPVPPAEAARIAAGLLRRQSIDRVLSAHLDRARKGRRIRYQAGFGPGAR